MNIDIRHVTCVELNKKMGKILLEVQRHPIGITQQKTLIAILISVQDYLEQIAPELPSERQYTSLYFHENYSKILETIEEGPILITRHSNPTLVILSRETFAKKQLTA